MEDPKSAPATVLVIEDDLAIGRSIADILEGEGYPVLLLNDAEAGLGILRHRGDIPLLLLDLKMPRMDGHAFLKAVAELPWAQKGSIVVMTAGPADLDRSPAFIKAVLKKPFELEDLLRLVELHTSIPEPNA